MTDYDNFKDTQMKVQNTKIRKTQRDGEKRFDKFILEVNGENMETCSMKLREYYSKESEEDIEGIQFNTEEAEPEPVKAEDIPEIVKDIQKELNENKEAVLEATVTRAKDGERVNWFINPENFDTIKLIR